MASVRGDQGLPCDGHSCLQLTPMDPLHNTTESISKASGILGKTYLREGKTQHSNVRSAEKKRGVRTIEGTPRSVKKEGEVVLQVREQVVVLLVWFGQITSCKAVKFGLSQLCLGLHQN